MHLWFDQVRFLLGPHRLLPSAAEETYALALVVDAPGARVALVGSRKNGPYRLFLLDLAANTLRELGEAPPPTGETFHGRWTWNPETLGRAVEMEPAVLRFEGDELRASYGKDSSKKRATSRRNKSWKLKA